jgi:excisionase family DNA binding protein
LSRLKDMKLTKKDISMAQTGLQALDSETRKKSSRKSVRLVFGAENTAEVNLPPQAVVALTEILDHLAHGREVTVSAQPVEYSTQQAAEYLRVSRPFLVGLLEKGEIPFRKVGTHRRVLFEDLQSYKEKIDAQRLKTLEELAAQAQELGLGY